MFKYITQAQFDKLHFKAGRSGHIKSRERLSLEALKVGEGVIITKKEWTLKTEPSGMLPAIKELLGHVLISRRLVEGGWAVMRVK